MLVSLRQALPSSSCLYRVQFPQIFQYDLSKMLGMRPRLLVLEIDKEVR